MERFLQITSILLLLGTLVLIFAFSNILNREFVLLRENIQDYSASTDQRITDLSQSDMEIAGKILNIEGDINELNLSLHEGLATNRNDFLQGINALGQRQRDIQLQIADYSARAEEAVQSVAASGSRMGGASPLSGNFDPDQLAVDDVSYRDMRDQARLSFESEQYSEALNLFGQLLENDPEDPQTRFYYFASAYLNNPADAGWHTAVLRELGDLLEGEEIEPNGSRTAKEIIAGIYFERNDWPSAIESYQSLAMEYPESAEYLRSMGLSALFAGEFTTAQNSLDQVTSLRPGSSEDLYYSGLAYYYDNKYQPALQRFEEGIELESPIIIPAYLKAGQSSQALGDHVRAIEWLQGYLARVDDFEGRFHLGISFKETGQYRLAENHLSSALYFLTMTSPGQRSSAVDCYSELSDVKWREGAFSEAISYAEQGLELDDENEMLNAQLARALADEGNVRRARRISDHIVSEGTDPDAKRIAQDTLDRIETMGVQ
jgi:tetratricopeptide (TPR) repeat protein